MNNKAITILCLAAVVLLSVAGTKVSKLTRTQTFASNDLFIVVTGSTVKVTRHVRAKDLAEGLGPWITNSGSGGSATNAVSTTRTNGTVISTVSTSLDFIEGTNVTLRATNAAGVVTVQINASGGGVGPTNGNQFGASLTLSIKDGALLTNISVRTALTLPTLTASRAAVLNSTGQLTNSAAVSDVEMEYLDGVTSAIQTQLDTKTALTTNANQFGASTTLTIKDGAKLTNAINEGITIFNGDSSNRANLIVKGAVNPKIRLTSISPPQVLQLSSTEISTDVGGGQPYITISPEAYPTLRINTNSLEAINSGYNLGTVTVPLGSIYAQNFIGSGTGVPIIKLQTMMSADNAFAITVATNRIASTTNTFDFTNAAVNDVIKVHSSSAGQVVWTNGAAAGGSQTPWAQNIDGGGYSLTNVQHVNVGTNINAPSQNSTLNISGTNSAGSMIGWEITSSNALFRLRSSTAPTAAIPLTVSTSGVVTATMFQTIGGASMSVGVLSTVGNSAGRVDVGAGASLKGRVNGTLDILDVSANATLHGVFLGGANQTNSQLQVLSSSTVNSNSTINVRSGNTNNWINFGAGSFDVVAVNNPTFTAPFSMNALQGAQLWSDGTNLCVVLQNSGGTRTTNKLSMTAWP